MGKELEDSERIGDISVPDLSLPLPVHVQLTQGEAEKEESSRGNSCCSCSIF